LYQQYVVFLNSYSEQVTHFFAEGNDVDEGLKESLKWVSINIATKR